jgi:hypothetical protein
MGLCAKSGILGDAAKFDASVGYYDYFAYL